MDQKIDTQDRLLASAIEYTYTAAHPFLKLVHKTNTIGKGFHGHITEGVTNWT